MTVLTPKSVLGVRCSAQQRRNPTLIKSRVVVVFAKDSVDRPDVSKPNSSEAPPTPSRRDFLKGGSSLGLGLLATRAAKLLGLAEVGVATERMAIGAAELLAKVGSRMQPTVQQLLKMGLRPKDVEAMLRNPALRPRNAAELQRWLM